MKERLFIQKAKEHILMEEFIRKQFRQAKCSKISVQHTPIVTRIVIHTTTPGLVIGVGGERIKETVDALKEKFAIENPQIDVQKITAAETDPVIIAQTLASQLESGVNFKKLGNYSVKRIMDAGAIGCEIVLSGKLSGQRSRKERFVAGYLKKCGETATRDVSKGFALANPKLGNIGVTVKIMHRYRALRFEPEETKNETKPEKQDKDENDRVKKEEKQNEQEAQPNKKYKKEEKAGNNKTKIEKKEEIPKESEPEKQDEKSIKEEEKESEKEEKQKKEDNKQEK